MVIYYFTRTIFNVQRAIEPLILAIVFVVWVGIGPFAGVLALTLHTIAALGKLYSEQVENIAQGPIEAVTATGANRLQTIVYAVIPQIVPPYIAFTIYRWDINVRMSTIIGFAGGGRDRLPAAAKFESAQISTGRRADDRHRHCGGLAGLYQCQDPRAYYLML